MHFIRAKVSGHRVNIIVWSSNNLIHISSHTISNQCNFFLVIHNYEIRKEDKKLLYQSKLLIFED